jgi:hypothetical protein
MTSVAARPHLWGRPAPSRHLFLAALPALARAAVMPSHEHQVARGPLVEATHSRGGRVSPLSTIIRFGSIRFFSEGT